MTQVTTDLPASIFDAIAAGKIPAHFADMNMDDILTTLIDAFPSTTEVGGHNRALIDAFGVLTVGRLRPTLQDLPADTLIVVPDRNNALRGAHQPANGVRAGDFGISNDGLSLVAHRPDHDKIIKGVVIY